MYTEPETAEDAIDQLTEAAEDFASIGHEYAIGRRSLASARAAREITREAISDALDLGVSVDEVVSVLDLALGDGSALACEVINGQRNF